MARGSGRHGGAAVRRRQVPASTAAASASAAASSPAAFPPFAFAKRLKTRWDALTTWQGYVLTTVVVAGPYAAWVLYLWLRLQSGLLREVVTPTTPRAVLIVGTQSSGTTQMSRRLASLGAEVGHETSDCAWNFARVPEKGRGVVVTKDVKAGDLLCVSSPLAVAVALTRPAPLSPTTSIAFRSS